MELMIVDHWGQGVVIPEPGPFSLSYHKSDLDSWFVDFGHDGKTACIAQDLYEHQARQMVATLLASYEKSFDAGLHIAVFSRRVADELQRMVREEACS